MDTERRLATIRTISDISPIPGADMIVKLTIDGWDLVSQKGSFKVGDRAVYFEIDSFLPVTPEFEFLRPRCFKSTVHVGDGFRLKTIKLRGQVSQGLALPLSDFPTIPSDAKEGDDVTDLLGVKKWEPAPEGNGSRFGPSGARGNFPDFLRKSDQERIQNCFGSLSKAIMFREEVSFHAEEPLIENSEKQFSVQTADGWLIKTMIERSEEERKSAGKYEVTLKLDGSSMTVYHNQGQIGVCSRNLDLKRIAGNVFWDTAIESRIIAALALMGRNVATQGELMGPGIQGNREGLNRHVYYVYNVFDIDAQRYLTPVERQNFFEDLSNLDIINPAAVTGVPWIEDVYFDQFESVSDFLEYADRPSIVHKVAEGVVFKPFDANGRSFKVISNKFLLAEKD